MQSDFMFAYTMFVQYDNTWHHTVKQEFNTPI